MFEAKVKVVPWSTLFDEPTPKKVKPAYPTPVYSIAAAPPSGLPTIDSTMEGPNGLWPQVLGATDMLALGILVFCGGLWMFGNRAPALQRLIDMTIGYEIIRHGLNILRWLKQF